MAPSFYVYRIFDGLQTLYIGKGSGRRLQSQKRKFGCDGEILEACKSDDHAFERERHWIVKLMPTENQNLGGGGGRCKPKRKPRILKEFAEIERIGSRRYVALFLLRKLDETNCEKWGMSLDRLKAVRAVAYG
jgi:hypothetical protein